jgi:hypothetical protein
LTYQRLEIEQFGRQLIALVGAELPEDQLKRWLVAYWCFYSVGPACWLSEHDGDDFWGHMWDAARNTTETPLGGRWPRGAERRHFRGQQAMKAVDELSERYRPRPDRMVDYIAAIRTENSRPPMMFEGVFKRAKEHRGFGDWIGFKVADMIDRCGINPVVFDEAAVFMFKDPALAVDVLWERRVGPIARSKFNAIERRHRTVERLIKEFSDLSAPPLRDRAINIQEVETVLCKWKSHMNGHYPLYKDSREIGHSLMEWAEVSETAKVMRARVPFHPVVPA